MSQYYRQNLDKLEDTYPLSTPRNAVIDVLFSDTQSTSTVGGGESVITLSANGGEYSIQEPLLVGADIILLFRDGLNWYETDDPFTLTDKEFSFDSNTGTITFPPAPFPPLNAGEKVTVSYIAAGQVIQVIEPVTLNIAKAWLRVTHDDEDLLITGLITAARQRCEALVNKSFVERTVTAIVRNDLGNIKLPYGPVGNVTFVYDVEGNEITSYKITGVSDKRLAYPMLSHVKVVYTAGLPGLQAQFRTALMMQLAWMYNHRGDEEVSLIAPDARAILSPYMINRV